MLVYLRNESIRYCLAIIQNFFLPLCRAHFQLWLSKGSATERRLYKCNVNSHWLRPCQAIDRKMDIVSHIHCDIMIHHCLSCKLCISNTIVLEIPKFTTNPATCNWLSRHRGILVKTGSGNILLHDIPLPEPILTCHELDTWKHISVKYCSNSSIFSHTNAFESVVCQMPSILSWNQWVEWHVEIFKIALQFACCQGLTHVQLGAYSELKILMTWC